MQAVNSLLQIQNSFGRLSDTDKEVNSELSPPSPLKEYCGSLINIHELNQAISITKYLPNFKVCQSQRYEISELCEIFFNRWAKYIYLLLLSLSSLFFAWSYAVVAATAWATVGIMSSCSLLAFLLSASLVSMYVASVPQHLKLITVLDYSSSYTSTQCQVNLHGSNVLDVIIAPLN